MLEDDVQIGGGEARIGAHAVDEPTVLAPHVDDQSLAGRELLIDQKRACVHGCSWRNSVANRPKMSSPTRRARLR